MPQSPLTTEQQRIVKALAAGVTLTAAAAASGIHRVTIYRWMHNYPDFQDALRRARANFILTRRDQLYSLSTEALLTLHNILENPLSSPAVLLRTAMFILTRPVAPKTGWTMPEPAPPPDSIEILDSSLIESGYAQLAGLCGIEREAQDEAPAAATDATSATPPEPAPKAPAEFPDGPVERVESVVFEPSTPLECPLVPPADAAKIQHVSPISEDVARAAMTPLERLKARYLRERDLDPDLGLAALRKATGFAPPQNEAETQTEAEAEAQRIPA